MTTAPARPSPRRGPLLPVLVALPVVGAVTTVVVTGRLTTWELLTEDVGAVVFSVLFLGWAVLPFAAAVAVGVATHRHWREGGPVAVVGGLLLLALTVALLRSVVTSDSSTAVIGLLYAPLLQAALVGLTTAATVGVARVRRRRAARPAVG